MQYALVWFSHCDLCCLLATGDLLDEVIDGGDTRELAPEVKMQKVLELSVLLRSKGKEQEACEVDSLALLLEASHSNPEQGCTELDGTNRPALAHFRLCPDALYCAVLTTRCAVLCCALSCCTVLCIDSLYCVPNHSTAVL